MKQWQIFLIFGLFMLVLNSFDSAEAAASPISISTEKYSGDILEGDAIVFTLTLDSNDTRYRNMEVYMVAHWPSGIAWSYYLVDYNYDELDSNLIRMGAGEQATINIMIICEGLCSAGDTNELRIYGLTDPRFYLTDYGEGEDPGNHTDTCGSADCKNDTTPASSSANITNIISLNLNARTGYTSVIACDAVASIGDNVFTPGETYLWGYTLTNTGWLSDAYQFDVDVTRDGYDIWYWEVDAGIFDGNVLTGQSNSSSSAVHSIEASMSITPVTNATSGVYNVELTVASAGGGADAGCSFDVVVPETEEETTGDPANETAEEETKEPGGTGEACTGCSAECCEFCADTDGECPYDCVYNEDQSDNPSSCLAPDEDANIIEEVPSISLISSIAVLGSIVIFRRKQV